MITSTVLQDFHLENSFMTRDFLLGMCLGYSRVGLSKKERRNFLIENDQQGRGYAYAMYLLPHINGNIELSPRWSAWVSLQRSEDSLFNENLFFVHPYIQYLMVAMASQDEHMEKLAREEFMASLQTSTIEE